MKTNLIIFLSLTTIILVLMAYIFSMASLSPVPIVITNRKTLLTQALTQVKLPSPSQFAYDQPTNVISFRIPQANNSTLVYFSTTKDLYFQSLSLQQLLKTATINGDKVTFVDLAAPKSYVQLQNN